MTNKLRWSRTLTEYAGLLAVLAGLIGLFGLLSDHFLSPITFRTLANQIPPLVVVAIGMTFVLSIAGIDLSVGSVLALSSAVLGVLLVQAGWPLWLCIIACMGTGLLCGLLNGAISERWQIPSFIVTLGMLEIARGGAYVTTASQTQYVGAAIAGVGAPGFLGLSPTFYVAVLLVIAGQVVLKRTVFGRYMVATGLNPEAARLSGINLSKIRIAVFALAGLLCGVAGVFQTAYLESVDPNAGIGMELAAIAAVVIGGTSLMGGHASVVNSFIGVLIIAVLQTGLAQIGADEPTKRIVTGGVIVLAVIADAYRQRMAGQRFSLRKLFQRPGG